MPEGDSYVRAANELRPVLVGRTIERVDGAPHVRKVAGRLVGGVVEAIRTNGKHLLIDIDSGLTIDVRLGMSGRWRVYPRARDLEWDGTPEAVRLLLRTANHTVVCHAAPGIAIERRRVIDSSLERLGPDILAPEFDWTGYRERAARAPTGMSVSDFLLDQRILAGVGNEYRNEILFLEGLHPTTPIGDLDPVSVDALADRARRLMLANSGRGTRVTHRGPAARSWVYQRTGQPCRRCRAPIQQHHFSARISYWCPVCQLET